MLALFFQNFISITKKTPFNWLQLSTFWVLLGVQLAGQHRDDSLRYYLLVHSLNTKNSYLCVTCVFTTAYIWKLNSQGILIGYNGIFIVFLKGHYRSCSVPAIIIWTHQYWCIRGKSWCANFNFLWSLAFSYSISSLSSHSNVDRHADALIHVAINLKLMILTVDFQ